MNKRRMAGFFCVIMPLFGLLSLVPFVGAFLRDMRVGDMEWFEVAARLLGYVLVLGVYGFSAAGAFRYRVRGAQGGPGRAAIRCVYAAIVLLCFHDVLLYASYGNQLEGTFTMGAFFALDAGLLILYTALRRLGRGSVGRRYAASPALRAVLAGIALLWALYILGDSAGYPVSHLYDWDEAALKFAFLCHACLLLCLGPPRSKTEETQACASPQGGA